MTILKQEQTCRCHIGLRYTCVSAHCMLPAGVSLPSQCHRQPPIDGMESSSPWTPTIGMDTRRSDQPLHPSIYAQPDVAVGHVCERSASYPAGVQQPTSKAIRDDDALFVPGNLSQFWPPTPAGGYFSRFEPPRRMGLNKLQPSTGSTIPPDPISQHFPSRRRNIIEENFNRHYCTVSPAAPENYPVLDLSASSSLNNKDALGFSGTNKLLARPVGAQCLSVQPGASFLDSAIDSLNPELCDRLPGCGAHAFSCASSPQKQAVPGRTLPPSPMAVVRQDVSNQSLQGQPATSHDAVLEQHGQCLSECNPGSDPLHGQGGDTGDGISSHPHSSDNESSGSSSRASSPVSSTPSSFLSKPGPAFSSGQSPHAPSERSCGKTSALSDDNPGLCGPDPLARLSPTKSSSLEEGEIVDETGLPIAKM